MSTPANTIAPPNWQSFHNPVAAVYLEDLIGELRDGFMMEGYEAFFQLWGANDFRKGMNGQPITFCSMGIRKAGKNAETGNKFSILYAFGFYYEDSLRWPEGFVDTIVERATGKYTHFLSGEWSPKDMNIYFNDDYIDKLKTKPVINWDDLEDDDDVDPLS